jgi:hypothetical protein
VHFHIGQRDRMAGTSGSFGQLNWMFCRVVKWP